MDHDEAPRGADRPREGSEPPADKAPLGREAVVVLGVLVVLGLLGGVLWWLLVSPAEFTKTAQGGVMGETELTKTFGADAWFSVVGGGLGLLAGLGLSLTRTRDPLRTSALLLLGSVVAAVLMSVTGHLLGPGSAHAALASASDGTRVPESLDVGTVPLWPLGAYLRNAGIVYAAWPLGAMVGALVVLVSRNPDRAAPAEDVPSDAVG